MVAVPLSASELALGVIAVGVLVAAGAAKLLADRRRDRAEGALVAIDAGAPRTLRSSRYRIAGRPDALRRHADGTLVPIERKSRAAPAGGPPRSHQVQVWAYCLLVEETEGRAPPYGVLRYGDGGEFRVRWDDAARHELLRLRAEMDRPYDGRATPSRAKCAHCRWVTGCDARAV
ncbi:MAG TPA: Dna2/Cas4 domain-containing protein [Thermoplasmata archaeon]|nr:Dna2/Cas4 domain-containing protein [Thermoplasmata archaeon]